ncbi:hypothetical protein [Lacticaseibacillus jixiensis]|uniref:hypothetical protein n=1 Tax=Lacticaseibacillus jixiensis TaxID=3231926 RepID=UPI0036F23FCB
MKKTNKLLLVFAIVVILDLCLAVSFLLRSRFLVGGVALVAGLDLARRWWNLKVEIRKWQLKHPDY